MSETTTKTRGKSRSGGDSRGSAATRRARKWWMLGPVAGFGGDGEKVACVHCGLMLDFETVEADRIVPGSRGGSYRRENVQPACRQCNASRRDDEEWTYATHRAPKLVDATARVDEAIARILAESVAERATTS